MEFFLENGSANPAQFRAEAESVLKVALQEARGRNGNLLDTACVLIGLAKNHHAIPNPGVIFASDEIYHQAELICGRYTSEPGEIIVSAGVLELVNLAYQKANPVQFKGSRRISITHLYNALIELDSGIAGVILARLNPTSEEEVA